MKTEAKVWENSRADQWFKPETAEVACQLTDVALNHLYRSRQLTKAFDLVSKNSNNNNNNNNNFIYL